MVCKRVKRNVDPWIKNSKKCRDTRRIEGGGMICKIVCNENYISKGELKRRKGDGCKIVHNLGYSRIPSIRLSLDNIFHCLHKLQGDN